MTTISTPLLTIPEAATLLGTSEGHVRDLVARGEIPFVRVGRLIRFRREHLTRWADQNTVDTAAPHGITTVDSGGLVLVCPQCGGTYTHVTAVTVLARAEDQDATEVWVRTGTRDEIRVGSIPAEDIPTRRHSVTLSTYCEGCGQITNLAFQQHKGQTLVTHQPVL